MITGFNTDIEHAGVVYHVQTEDKGLENPLILSLVYVGGAILASKRSPYNDLIADGFEEQALAERLQRQHKLICAAIRAGRIEDLKRMTAREALARHAKPDDAKEKSTSAAIKEQIAAPPQTSEKPAPPAVVQQKPPARSESVKVSAEPPVKVDFREVKEDEKAAELHLSLLEEQELHAGEYLELRIRLSRGKDQNARGVAKASIALKILGTSFRPIALSETTDENGIAFMYASLPHFTTGRAAILLRAIANGQETELRRIIHPARKER